MELFYFFATLAVIFSLLVVLLPNPMYSIISLVATFFTFSILYILLNAQFIAIVNFIVYMGAIMVLFLFVVMLLDMGKRQSFHAKGVQRIIGITVACVFLGLLLRLSFSIFGTPSNGISGENGLGSVQALGKVLYSSYLYPFELASVLLLAAMVGAVILAKKN